MTFLYDLAANAMWMVDSAPGVVMVWLMVAARRLPVAVAAE